MKQIKEIPFDTLKKLPRKALLYLIYREQLNEKGISIQDKNPSEIMEVLNLDRRGYLYMMDILRKSDLL